MSPLSSLAMKSALWCSSSCGKGQDQKKKKAEEEEEGEKENERGTGVNVIDKEGKQGEDGEEYKLKQEREGSKKKRTTTTLSWPLPAAQWRGVYLALSRAETEAPDCTRSWTTSRWPCMHKEREGGKP